MEGQRIDSSRWTGNLDYSRPPLSPRQAQVRLQFAFPILAVVAVGLVYFFLWHVIWKLAGSIPVYGVPRPSDLLLIAVAGLAGYFLARNRSKWALTSAAFTAMVALCIARLGFFALDLYRPLANGEQRVFVEGAARPMISRYETRLEYELRLSLPHGGRIEATAPESLFRTVVTGGTCLQIRWTGGREYRFFKVLKQVPIDSGTSSIGSPDSRAACFAAPPA